MQQQPGMTSDDIRRIERTLFYEPPDLRTRLIRFTALIIFASVIASGGLLADSVASIIGAMIIAPLMTPIMGMVVATVMGSVPRIVRCAIIVVSGIFLAVAVGWLMGELMPTGWDPLNSAQIMARTYPRLLDLVVALASGGAGAYALSRSDVADALPGVAIAISLVPPLNTVGLLLAGGETKLASQAALLFLTNFAAILLAGTVTFVITGLAEGSGRSPRQLGRSLVAIGVFVALIVVPLAANSQNLWSAADREDRSLAIVTDWLSATDWEVYEIKVDGNKVDLELAGDGELPPTDAVIEQLRGVIGDDMELTARIVSVRKETIVGSSTSS